MPECHTMEVTDKLTGTDKQNKLSKVSQSIARTHLGGKAKWGIALIESKDTYISCSAGGEILRCSNSKESMKTCVQVYFYATNTKMALKMQKMQK